MDDFLFNLIVLGSLTDQEGYVWRRSKYDLYVIEAMPIILSNRETEVECLQNSGWMSLMNAVLLLLQFN